MLYISLLMIAVLIGASLIFSGYDRKRLKYTYKMKGFNNFFYPFACWLYRHFVKGHTQKRLDLIRQLYPAADPEKIQEEKYLKNITYALILLLTVNAASIALCITGQGNDFLEGDYKIQRNALGGGSKSFELEASIDEESIPVEVTVGEKRLSEEEISWLQEQCHIYIDTHVLGENMDLNCITCPLNFMSEIPEYSVTLFWETSDYLLIGMDGTVKNQELKAPITVQIKAVCTYFDISWEYRRDVTVYPAKQESAQGIREEIYEALAISEDRTISENYLILPRKIGGKSVSWSQSSSFGPGALVIAGCMIVVLLFVREGEGYLKAQKKRSQELFLEYPVFVHKVVLLLETGMTPKAVWSRIISDYNKTIEEGGPRKYVYEEMIMAANEMKYGVTETAAYENFGRRCGLSQYLRFSSILIQSVKTGARGMGRMLSDAKDEAVIMRQESAKRLGEEAGTKLLFPMIILLGVVMFIVMIPAFMSMNL